MEIHDIMTKDLAICASDTSLAEAAQTMRARNIGDVLVRDQSDRICGIVTDRDLVVRGVAANAEPASSPVGNICDEELHSLTLDASIEDIVQLMQDKAVRRVPIMDGSEPVGIVSLGDLAQALDRDSVLGRISAARPDP